MKRIPHKHQVEILEKLKLSLLAGKRRPMIQCPTGSGKTMCAAMIIEGALRKGNKVIFVVPAISLIDQTVNAFWEEGIEDVGVIQANHYLTDYSKPVQVASIQTLMRRTLQTARIIIIDEAHRQFAFVRKWMEQFPETIFIGLSATPWTKGLGKHYDDLIIGETTQGLIDKGILSRFRVFAPAHPDLASVKITAGDYNEQQLSQVMQDGGLIGEVVHTWLQLGEYRPTLCFAVDCAHARKIQEKFIGAGISCGYIDADTPMDERTKIKEQFERGTVKIVCSVACLIMGVDWDVRCIIMARPTKSPSLYVQCIGRGLRTAQGKQDLIIIDHSDNTLRLGFVTDVNFTHLDDGKKSPAKKPERKESLPKECKKCHYVKPAGVYVCPNCGFEAQRISDIQEHFGELQEVTKVKKYTMAEKQLWFSGLLRIAQMKGYSTGWASNTYREKFGVWPNQLSKIATEPTNEVQNYVLHKAIRYAKRVSG